MSTVDAIGNTEENHLAPHQAARPMEVIKDKEGELWLCDKGVDKSRDLRAQGCWRCGEVAFTRDD